MLKSFISLGLTVLFLAGTLHVDHVHSHNNGESICNIGCNDDDHHSLSHQCEKCLTNNSKLVERKCQNFIYDRFSFPLYNLNNSIDNTLTYFSLYSRPPPKPYLI